MVFVVVVVVAVVDIGGWWLILWGWLLVVGCGGVICGRWGFNV